LNLEQCWGYHWLAQKKWPVSCPKPCFAIRLSSGEGIAVTRKEGSPAFAVGTKHTAV
jgi:hypothetical protein